MTNPVKALLWFCNISYVWFSLSITAFACQDTVVLQRDLELLKTAGAITAAADLDPWNMAQKRAELPTTPTLDSASVLCLSCHDGSLATGGEFSSTAVSATMAPHASHPVGIDYLESFTSKRGALRPPYSIRRELSLVNGKLSCVSCHEIQPTGEMELVVANSGSALCFACHNR